MWLPPADYYIRGVALPDSYVLLAAADIMYEDDLLLWAVHHAAFLPASFPPSQALQADLAVNKTPNCPVCLSVCEPKPTFQLTDFPTK